MKITQIVKTMYSISINDQDPDGFLTVNLIDILQSIEPAVLGTEWEISNLECLGPNAEKLHQVADSKQQISGCLLLELANQITQVIDGKFQGYRLPETQPWLSIIAVDSTVYDIETRDEKVFNQLRQKFQPVKELSKLLAV